jgi:hypothetical protein
VVGVLALLGFLCGFALALKRREMAEQWLLVRMQEAGLPAPSLWVERMDWGVLEVRELRAGRELEVAHLEASFDLHSLLEGRLRGLRVRGVEMTGAPDAVRPVLAAFGMWLSSGSDAGPVVWDRFDLESARLVLDTPLGDVETLGSGQFVRLGETGVEGEARIEATRGMLRARAAFSGSRTTEALEGELELELVASGSFESGSLEAARWSAQAALRGRPDAWQLVLRKCADLSVDGLVFDGVLVLAAPVRACLGKPEQLMLAGASASTGEHSLEGSLELPPIPVTLDLGRDATRAEGESPRLTLTLAGVAEQPKLGVVSRGGFLGLAEHGVEVRGLEGSLQWSPAGGVDGNVRVDEIQDVSDERRFPRLRLGLEAHGEAEGVSFAIVLSDDARLLVLELAGRVPGPGGPVRAELSLEPVSVGSDGVELLRLLPAFAEAEASGSLAALGSLEWAESTLSGSVDVALRDLDLSSSVAHVELANGVVRIEGPEPILIPPGQLVSMARLDLGLELRDGVARFAVSPEGELMLEESEWTLAGGRAAIRGSLDPEAETPLTLTVKGADPSELFALLDLAGLEGEGSLSGTLVLARGEVGLVIESASLASDGEGGWIRYRPEPEEPEEVREALAPRAEALANFRYDELQLELAGQMPGAVRVSVTLVGANPDLGESSPVELRFDVPGVLEPDPDITIPEAIVPPEVAERLAAFEARQRSLRP